MSSLIQALLTILTGAVIVVITSWYNNKYQPRKNLEKNEVDTLRFNLAMIQRAMKNCNTCKNSDSFQAYELITKDRISKIDHPLLYKFGLDLLPKDLIIKKHTKSQEIAFRKDYDEIMKEDEDATDPHFVCDQLWHFKPIVVVIKT